MIYAVFLCDLQWKITGIQQCSHELDLKAGEFLTDLVAENLKTVYREEEQQYSQELTLLKQDRKMPTFFHFYREGTLVVFSVIHNNQEFLEFYEQYNGFQEWAKDRLLGLFHNEYYRIQQINNQLVDAKRQLIRSNHKLEQALKENREINEKLDRARILAERASSSKSNFLANMSHDIRTPMNAIIGLTELMEHHLDQPELLGGYLKKLRSSGRYLLDLINDILDLSKIENGSLELKYEPMDLKAELEQILSIIRPQITEKKLELSVKSEHARFGMLQGDPVRFRQVLMNVFSNAIKYTPEGGTIYFLVREAEPENGKRMYRFIIEDSGMGMSPEFLEHLFEPFARAESSAREIQGTGLGMAITKSIVDALDGTIRVSSALGKGSRFTISLPFAVCGDETSNAEGFLEEQQEKAQEFSGLKGKRFLCAEDNELNAEILSAMMEMEGAECRIYRNGKELVEAFEDLKQGQCDAILMDVQMPVMGGYEATRRIRKSGNPLGQQIPIIAMTANAFTEDVQNCLNAGMNAHISKPLDFDKLKEILMKQETAEE